MKNKAVWFGIPLLLVAAVIALVFPVFGNCAQDANGEIRDTPVRVGVGRASGTLAKRYDLASAMEDSDLVVDLTVTSWVSENKGQMHTLFDAKINTVIKGDSLEKITLIQSGTGEITYKNYPLFRIGDRLLLFLKKSVQDEVLYVDGHDASDYENAYWIIGAHTTVMDIQTIGKTAYVMDRIGVLSEGFGPGHGLNDVASSVRGRLFTQIQESDPVLAEHVTHKAVFLYEEILQTLQSMTE